VQQSLWALLAGGSLSAQENGDVVDPKRYPA
jgi:hypothetical protein